MRNRRTRRPAAGAGGRLAAGFAPVLVVALALAATLAGLPAAGAGTATDATTGTGTGTNATTTTGTDATGTGSAPPTAVQQDLLARHSRRIDELRHTAEMLLGPLPAVAATPFFGLAALSAAGLAARSETVQSSHHPWVRALRDNDLIRETQRYASWPLLLTFLALALITFLANSGKVRGVAGKLLRVVEDSSSALIYFALSVGALKLATAAPAAATAASALRAAAAPQLAGFFDTSVATLIALGLSIGLGAMMVTRYACDVLIWLIPVPLVDFGFEVLKKVLTLGFLCLYLFAPGVAAALAFVLLLPALMIAPWALRVLSFALHVLLRPALAWLLPALRPQILDPHLVAHYGTDLGMRRAAADLLAASSAAVPDIAGVTLGADAVALQLARLPRRTHGCLLRTREGLSFVTMSPFGRRRVWPLPAPGHALSLVPALLWTELRATAADGTQSCRIALPRSLDRARLAALLGAPGDFAPPAPAPAAPAQHPA